MIDFTNFPRRNKTYAGANGKKISVLYDGEQYMLKFPTKSSINHNMSDANGCISEYLGCHIFQSVGIPVQETLLGTYTSNGKEKIVVACKDFAPDGLSIQDFASLKNTMIDSVYSGYATELVDIVRTIEEQTAIDRQILSDRFWDMFIIDALIGNRDRHNGNWGFLYNGRTDEVWLAPVYDCGNCLYPQADEETIRSVLLDSQERNRRIFENPCSAIKINGQKINYFKFISSSENKDCNRALKRIFPRIDMKKITKIVEYTPFLSDLQKDFYMTMLSSRKDKILEFSYNRLRRREQNISEDGE